MASDSGPVSVPPLIGSDAAALRIDIVLGGCLHRQGGVRRQRQGAGERAACLGQGAGDLSIDISLRRSLQRRGRIGGEYQRSGECVAAARYARIDVLLGRGLQRTRRIGGQRQRAGERAAGLWAGHLPPEHRRIAWSQPAASSSDRRRAPASR